MAQDVQMPLALDQIIILDGRRQVDPAVVGRIAESVEKIGLRHPITVRKRLNGGQYVLVAGLRRALTEAFGENKVERVRIDGAQIKFNCGGWLASMIRPWLCLSRLSTKCSNANRTNK
jgi:hypothetical protein